MSGNEGGAADSDDARKPADEEPPSTVLPHRRQLTADVPLSQPSCGRHADGDFPRRYRCYQARRWPLALTGAKFGAKALPTKRHFPAFSLASHAPRAAGSERAVAHPFSLSRGGVKDDC